MIKEKKRTNESKKNHTNSLNNDTHNSILKPLIQEIDTLKQQLKTMKNRKLLVKPTQIKTLVTSCSANNLQYHQYSPSFTDCVSPNNKNTTLQIDDREFIQIRYSSKDKLLKLQIQFNKLKRLLQRQQIKESFIQINEILKLINRFNKQQQDNIFRCLNQQDGESDQEWKDKANYAIKYKKQLQNNKRLQKQIENIIKQMEQLKQKQIQSQQKPINKRQQQFIIISHNNVTLQQQIDKIKEQLQSYQQSMLIAEEKCKTYEIALQKKQRQILLQQADIDYLRIQTEKTRSQKKELESLYDQFTKKHKQTVKKFQLQLQQAVNQKKQIKHELSLRRQQYQQILTLNQQKNYLLKQIQQIREDLTHKNTQFNHLKTRFYQEQKKAMELQSQTYKLTAQNDKLSRNVEYLKQQVSNLGRQLQQLCQKNKNNRIADKEKEQKEKNQNKILILSELTALVKQHRSQIIRQ